MKKLFIGIIISLFTLSQGYCANEWCKGTGEDVILGTENAADIDTVSFANIVDPLDRLLAGFRQGCKLVYASAATITVNLGEVTCSNSAGTIRKFRRNTSNTTVAWTDIDAGGEAASTTYYIFAVGDADATTFTCKISTNSSAPTGVTYYKRLGSFYNDSSSNITKIANDNTQIDWGVYDSGWFAVATATSYSKTHSLGTTKVLTSVYLSENSDGSGKCALMPTSDDSYAIDMTSLTTTTIAFRGRATYIYQGVDSSGNLWQPSSGYLRILMVALE